MLDSRLTIREWPDVPPSKCIVCGANHRRDGRKYIDFGLNIKMYGAVYFCTICVSEAAKMLGYLNPLDAQKLEEDWEAKNTEVDGLKDQNDKFRRALSELDFLGNIRDAVSNDVADPDEGTSSMADSDNESVNAVERSEDDNARSNESSNEQGPSDVPDDAGGIDAFIGSI